MQSKHSSLFHLKLAGEGDEYSLAAEFGAMLPKTGIYSLPDFEVLTLQKAIDQYIKTNLEEEQKYLEAKDARLKFKQLSKDELRKQMRKMQRRQALELREVEAIQRAQFIQFTNAWDVYM